MNNTEQQEDEPICQHKTGKWSGNDDHQYWSCDNCDYYYEQ